MEHLASNCEITHTIDLLQNHLDWFLKDKILHKEQRELERVIKMLKEKQNERKHMRKWEIPNERKEEMRHDDRKNMGET